MTGRLKVQVVGPAGGRWLSVPATAPVGRLLPALVSLVAGPGAEAETWLLAPPVGRPFDADASLGAQGIRPGTTLCLVASRLVADAQGGLPPYALVGMRTPLDRTAAVLPVPLTAWERVRAAFELARERPPEAPAAAQRSLHPAAFTQARRAGLLRRGWRAWRDLDRVARLRRVVTAPRLRRGVIVAVVSPGSGMGRTVVTTLVGTLMAHLRTDRVIAGDAAAGAQATLAPVLTLTRLDASMTQGSHGLRVLPAGADAETLERLRRFAGLLLVDCGPGLEAATSRAGVAAADQLLVVSDATPPGRLGLAGAVEGLRRDGRSVIVVANAHRSAAAAHDAGRIAVSAPDADGLVSLPWCPAGARQLEAGTLDWERPPRPWRLAGHELAAALARDWERRGLA